MQNYSTHFSIRKNSAALSNMKSHSARIDKESVHGAHSENKMVSFSDRAKTMPDPIVTNPLCNVFNAQNTPEYYTIAWRFARGGNVAYKIVTAFQKSNAAFPASNLFTDFQGWSTKLVGIRPVMIQMLHS